MNLKGIVLPENWKCHLIRDLEGVKTEHRRTFVDGRRKIHDFLESWCIDFLSRYHSFKADLYPVLYNVSRCPLV